MICFCEDDEAELIRVCNNISDPAFNFSVILCIFRYFLILPIINWNNLRLVCKFVSYVCKVVLIYSFSAHKKCFLSQINLKEK